MVWNDSNFGSSQKFMYRQNRGGGAGHRIGAV